MAPPPIRYAKNGSVHIAYQVLGDGPIHLVLVHGWLLHLEVMWDEPSIPRFHESPAGFGRRILFDKRGTGLSDRVAANEFPTLEQRMEDMRGVLDAVGSQRTTLMGISEGGPMCALSAATPAERTAALVMCGGYAHRIRDDESPREQHEAASAAFERGWDTPISFKTVAATGDFGDLALAARHHLHAVAKAIPKGTDHSGIAGSGRGSNREGQTDLDRLHGGSRGRSGPGDFAKLTARRGSPCRLRRQRNGNLRVRPRLQTPVHQVEGGPALATLTGGRWPERYERTSMDLVSRARVVCLLRHFLPEQRNGTESLMVEAKSTPTRSPTWSVTWWRSRRPWAKPAPVSSGTTGAAGLEDFYWFHFNREGVVEAEFERDLESALRQVLFTLSGDVPVDRPPLPSVPPGHWIQQERPLEVNAALLRLLASDYPA